MQVQANSLSTPTDVAPLCSELPTHDIHITASIEEVVVANHSFRGPSLLSAGSLSQSGGSIGDYCKEYGEGYNTFDEMLVAIDNVVNKYSI